MGESCETWKVGWVDQKNFRTDPVRIGLVGHYIASWSEMNIDHTLSPVIMTDSQQGCQVTELLWIPTIPSLLSCQQASEQITQFHASSNSG